MKLNIISRSLKNKVNNQKGLKEHDQNLINLIDMKKELNDLKEELIKKTENLQICKKYCKDKTSNGINTSPTDKQWHATLLTSLAVGGGGSISALIAALVAFARDAWKLYDKLLVCAIAAIGAGIITFGAGTLISKLINKKRAKDPNSEISLEYQANIRKTEEIEEKERKLNEIKLHIETLISNIEQTITK